MPVLKRWHVPILGNYVHRTSAIAQDALLRELSAPEMRLEGMHNADLAQQIAVQDGVITLEQAIACGLSESAVRRRVASKEWRRLYRGVYFAGTHRASHEARLRAAVFAAGKDAVASGLSAAWWHGLVDLPPARPAVTVPTNRQVRRTQQLNLRRRDVPKEDLTALRGLEVTGLALCVLEAAVLVPNGSVLMDSALQKHLSLAELVETHQRNASRTGCRVSQRLLDSAAQGGRSEVERLFHQILRRNGFRDWQAQLPVCGFVVDVAFVAARVIIEVDGWAFHSDSAQRNRDVQRQNALVNAGWRVLRFDWHRLVSDPEGIVEEIRRALKTGMVVSSAR